MLSLIISLFLCLKIIVVWILVSILLVSHVIYFFYLMKISSWKLLDSIFWKWWSRLYLRCQSLNQRDYKRVRKGLILNREMCGFFFIFSINSHFQHEFFSRFTLTKSVSYPALYSHFHFSATFLLQGWTLETIHQQPHIMTSVINKHQSEPLYIRYYAGHQGRYGHEFLGML